ncbi:unnamed protein product [Mycena citricolor]|uniref:Transmembrane protein n=1 Tax=Mycena citricolor TaxID=2018698 RepID=A0AAD2HHS1_9AGAR|nr:unnamed protein product [Mycena citricolor]
MVSWHGGAGYDERCRLVHVSRAAIKIWCHTTVSTRIHLSLPMTAEGPATARTGMVLNQLVLYATNTCITTSVVAGATAICLAISPDTYVWALFFLAMPGSFMTAFLANVNRNFIRPKATRALSSNIGAMHFSANPTLGDDRLGAGSILAVGSMNQAMASRSINDDDELDAVEMEMDKIEPGRNQSFLPF